MNLPFGIQQSTLAGGLSGLAAWGIGLGLTALGITVPPTVITGVVAILVPLVVHFVPDAAKVDAKIKEIAGELPQTYSASTDFPQAAPQDKGTATPNNINNG